MAELSVRHAVTAEAAVRLCAHPPMCFLATSFPLPQCLFSSCTVCVWGVYYDGKWQRVGDWGTGAATSLVSPCSVLTMQSGEDNEGTVKDD